MLGVARAPGTCGELVQGQIGGTNFLVTCPVDLYSTVTVKLNKTGFIKVDESLPKVRFAVEKTLQLLGAAGFGAEIEVSSAIPQGKGMASSSADIAAACAATAAAMEMFIFPLEIAGIALAIEPTDGVMIPGIAMFDHIDGKISRVFGQAPEIEVLIVDLGGVVDTVSFNASPDLEMLNRLKEQRITLALEKIEKAFALNQIELIGEAATESAFANQRILYKPELERIYEICAGSGGLGVNVAHSGTVTGMLFDPARNLTGRARNILLNEGFNIISKARLIDGGVEVLQERAGEIIWQPLKECTGETSGRLRKNTG